MLIIGEQKENVIVYKAEKEDEGKDIKQILKKKLCFSSRLLTKLKKGKSVFLNDEYVPYHQLIKKGDIIKISIIEKPGHFEPENIPLEILYEDIDVIVVNKQPGIVTHPTKSHPKGTIANAVTHYLKHRQQSYKIRFVNRLDMDTSGLLVIAKNAYSQHVLSEQMKKNQIQKKYITFVNGIVRNDSGIIDAPIFRPAEDCIKRIIDENGQQSLTKYRVLERYRNASKLEVELITGRTHQIRVHMEHIGNPIIGDSLYGNEDKRLMERQALHAGYLKFQQPRYRKMIEVEAPIPFDMISLQEQLRKE